MGHHGRDHWHVVFVHGVVLLALKGVGWIHVPSRVGREIDRYPVKLALAKIGNYSLAVSKRMRIILHGLNERDQQGYDDENN